MHESPVSSTDSSTEQQEMPAGPDNCLVELRTADPVRTDKGRTDRRLCRWAGHRGTAGPGTHRARPGQAVRPCRAAASGRNHLNRCHGGMTPQPATDLAVRYPSHPPLGLRDKPCCGSMMSRAAGPEVARDSVASPRGRALAGVGGAPPCAACAMSRSSVNTKVETISRSADSTVIGSRSPSNWIVRLPLRSLNSPTGSGRQISDFPDQHGKEGKLSPKPYRVASL